MLRAAGLDDVEELLASMPDPITIIFDADNTLVPQGVPVAVFQRDVSKAISRFERRPAVARVAVLTNGPDRGVPLMIHRGNKPWTSRRRLGLSRTDHAIWVVGDQILTDGILAWRLGAGYIHLAIDVANEANRQAAMRRLGSWIRRLLFVP
jgi:predicted HAD superfamily phosphohydrolase YqeG